MYQTGSFTLDINLTDGVAHQFALYALDWDNAGRTQRFDVYDSSTNAVIDSRTLSSFAGGQYIVWSLKGHVKIKVTQLVGINAVVSGFFFGGSNGSASSVTPSASFLGLDSSTRGNWKGYYGTEGFSVFNDSVSYPSYAQVTAIQAQPYSWLTSTTDLRALQKAVATDRIAACLYQGSIFSFDVNVTDGRPHRLAVYVLDWDNAGRSERFDVVDAGTNALLDSRTVSSFSNGQYLFWNITGHVKLNVTPLTVPNGVVSGLFFDPPR